MTSHFSRMSAPSSSPSSSTADGPGGARLVRATAVEMVAADLRQRILSGKLAPGSALRQEALAEELGVSRIPLREAIRLLSSEGLVNLQPHRGAYVAQLSVDEVQEFFELRVQLEPWLLRLAVPQLQPADLARAEALVNEMDSAPADAWSRLNWQLHETLYRPANRPFALNIVRTLHEKSERYLNFRVVSVPQRLQARQEHMELIRLSRAGQTEAAATAMKRHIGSSVMEVITVARDQIDDAGGGR